jgi:hypothetical protein
MRRFAVAVAVAVCGSACACVVIVACAKAPETRPNATTESSVEPTADDASSAVALSDASAAADGRVPGLPMPQKFPHFVWDAAGAPSHDAGVPR